MRNVRLLRGRVRIKPDGPAERIGSIIVPHIARDDGRDRTKPRTGVVKAMGAPALTKSGYEVPPGFEVGDRVIYVFGQIEVEGDAMCAQSEILGVVEPLYNLADQDVN